MSPRTAVRTPSRSKFVASIFFKQLQTVETGHLQTGFRDFGETQVPVEHRFEPQ
jgi:hypothetical protein